MEGLKTENWELKILNWRGVEGWRDGSMVVVMFFLIWGLRFEMGAQGVGVW